MTAINTAFAYEHFSVSLEEYVQAFKTSATQVGACFAFNGRIRGIELFDVSDTCGKLMPRLIRSYALDAIEEGDSPNNPYGEGLEIYGE